MEVLAFGPPAFVLGVLVAARFVRTWRHLLLAALSGAAVIVAAAVVGLSQVESTGSEDFGTGAVIALLGGANALGWIVGVGLGALIGMRTGGAEAG